MLKGIMLAGIMLFATLLSSAQHAVVNGLVKSMTMINEPDHKITNICTYTYDSSGRVTTEKWAEPGYPAVTFTYYYYTDSMVVTNSEPGGHVFRTVLRINAKGYQIGDGKAYDEQGYLIEYRPGIAEAGYITINTIVDGDIISQKSYQKGILIDQPTIWSYYPTPDLRKRGKDFEGHPNKHLIKTESFSWKGSEGGILHYTYKFDAKGRVQSMSISGPLNPGRYTKYEYTYFD